MSKALPVYELSQWIKSDRNIGYVVARMSAASVWEVRDDYANRKDAERFNGRGAGYVIQWVDLDYLGAGAEPSYVYADPIGWRPRRLSWLRAETIAEKRYQPCENPVKAPDAQSDSAAQIELEQAICAEESQPALPLDIEARWCGGAEQVVEAMTTVENAAVDIMRAVVAAGKKAEDWLIARGLTP